MLSSKAPDKTPPANSLPQRWKRGRQQAAFVALVALAFFTGSLYRQSGADELDSWWLRARFSLREWLNTRNSPPPLEQRMVLVDIDDKTSDKWFDEPTPYWGQHFADVVNQLNRSGAQVIAFDWTQPSPTDDLFHWDHDAKWGEALSQAQNVVFVKFLRSGGYVLPTVSLLLTTPGAYLDGGESNLGYAELPNRDGVQYSYFPQVSGKAGQKTEVSFGLRIVQKAGEDYSWQLPIRPDGSFLINFADDTGKAKSPFQRVSFCDVAAANTFKKADPRFKNKIVFIGASNKGNNDRHTVPFLDGFLGSRLVDGVEVHMNAVANMMDDSAIKEPSQKMVWLIAMGLGAIGVGAYALQAWGRATVTVGTLSIAWIALSFILFKNADVAIPMALPLLSLVFGSALMGGYRTLSEERERRQVMKSGESIKTPD